MNHCPNYDSYGCNFTCPTGSSWSVCPPPTRFIGCCAQDPCENGCPLDSLYPASFSNALYDIISPNVCPDNNSSWYTCNFTTPTFLGCCVNGSKPCSPNGCPSGSLRPAAWITQPPDGFSNQYSIFLDGGPTASSAVPTTPATASTTSANSATTVQNPSSTGNKSSEDGVGDGLSRSDKIALGIGLGIGIPSALAAIITCFFQILRR